MIAIRTTQIFQLKAKIERNYEIMQLFLLPLAISSRTGAKGVNLAGKVKNLFLVPVDLYRQENRKIEVCRVSGGGGPIGVGGPRESQVS